MHRYQATILWERGASSFTDKRYSRAHEWRFDGGISVPASSSPQVVPLPYSTEAAVDPEEALVAAASSCHMLSFLYVAAKQGYVVDSYLDEAYGLLERVERRKLAVTRIGLRPRIAFSGPKLPTPSELADLHHQAHEECYIANSLKAEIMVEAPQSAKVDAPVASELAAPTVDTLARSAQDRPPPAPEETTVGVRNRDAPPLSIDAEELIFAMHGQDGEIRSFLDTQTGEVLTLIPDDFREEEDDTAERIEEEPDRFVEIEQVHSSEGYEIMERFVEQLPSGRARSDLERALSGRKPFRTFKDRLLEYPKLREEWFAFENAAYVELAREWLKEEEINAGLRLRLPS